MVLPTINRTLLPLKAANSFYAFSFFAIVPFTPVFLRQIGLDAEQSAIINGTRMFILCLTGPLWGILADKKQKHRRLLAVQIICSTLLMFLAPWIVRAIPTNSNDSSCILSMTLNLSSYNLNQNKTSRITKLIDDDRSLTGNLTSYNLNQNNTSRLLNLTDRDGSATNKTTGYQKVLPLIIKESNSANDSSNVIKCENSAERKKENLSFYHYAGSS